MKDGGDPPAIKARLLPPTTNTGVLIHSQTEKVTGSPPANQSTFKVNDSTRTVKTGGKPPGPRPLHNLDKGSDGESDSAWGAWGHGEWSADPTIESGKTVSGKRIGMVAAEETPRCVQTPRRRSTGTMHPEAIGEKQSSPSGPPTDNEPDQADT